MSLEVNWKSIRETVHRACDSVGRDAASVTVVAVSKTVSVDDIKSAYDLGIRNFGESRLQEALPKIEALPKDIVWHFIGRLQSNKARKIASVFQVVHTVENQGQIHEMDKAGRTIEGLIEVNIGREVQKAGVFAEKLDETVRVLSSSCHVQYRGLMTIGPLTPDPELSRAVFRELAELGKRHVAEWLSMGMSADYDVAIQEGATHVRVGSALFGERK